MDVNFWITGTLSLIQATWWLKVDWFELAFIFDCSDSYYVLFENCIKTTRKINNVYMERCDVVAHAGKVDVDVGMEEQLVHDLVDNKEKLREVLLIF